MIPQPLLENLEVLLKVSSDPVTLHYDTVFNIGDFYLSTLVFRNSMFKKIPSFHLHSLYTREDTRKITYVL